jgi:hypothetical protein
LNIGHKTQIKDKENNPDSLNIEHKTQIKDKKTTIQTHSTLSTRHRSKTKQNNTTQTTKNMTCPHQKTTGVNRGSHKKGMQFLFLIKSEKRLVGDGENKTMYIKGKISIAI